VIKAIYQALGNYLRIPVGNGRDHSFEFDLSDFCSSYKFSSGIAFSSLKLLEKEGYFVLGDAVHTPSRIFFKTDSESLYRFQVENAFYDPFIKTILRSYSGVFSEFVNISEEEIGKRTGLTPDKVSEMLVKLSKLDVLDFVPRSDNPRITFTQDRIEGKDITLSPGVYRERMRDAEQRLEAVISYATSRNTCRSQALLAYFGEYQSARCGKCDICIERNKAELSDLEMNTIIERIRPVLMAKACTLEEIIATSSLQEDKVIRAVQWLVDSDKLEILPDRRYHWI
jgi:ATP-dependent DNA helicase RecQ